jgi:hypothetical protein
MKYLSFIQVAAMAGVVCFAAARAKKEGPVSNTASTSSTASAPTASNAAIAAYNSAAAEAVGTSSTNNN